MHKQVEFTETLISHLTLTAVKSFYEKKKRINTDTTEISHQRTDTKEKKHLEGATIANQIS